MPETGPHVAVAALCERVISEGDGVISLIRVVDRLTQTATGPDPPEEMPPLVVDNVQCVIALKSDQARGRNELKLVMEGPDGARELLGAQDITLEPGNRGINIIAGVRLGLAHEGVYWIDVLFGPPGADPEHEQLLTRIPVEVVYQRQRVPRS